MSSYELSEETLQNIEYDTGIPKNNLAKLTMNEMDIILEKKIKRKLVHSYERKNSPIIGRGSVYLYLKRFLKMNTIDKKLSKI